MISMKYNRKRLSGLQPSFYMWRFIAFLPLGLPLKRVLHYCEARGSCPLWSGWCLDLLTWPTLKNFLFIREIWRKWTAGQVTSSYWSVWLQVWHPWLVFTTSLILRAVVAWGPCFMTLTVPNQFRYPVSGQEPSSLTHTYHRLLTEERIFSPAYYYAVGTGGHAVKCHIISAVLWINFLHTSLLFISTYQTSFTL